MKTVFTDKEISVYKSWLLGRKNKEIASEFNVSEPYVSQVIKKVNEKITTIENSIKTLQEMNIVEIPQIQLSNEGRETFLKRHTEQNEKKKLISKPLLKSIPIGESQIMGMSHFSSTQIKPYFTIELSNFSRYIRGFDYVTISEKKRAAEEKNILFYSTIFFAMNMMKSKMPPLGKGNISPVYHVDNSYFNRDINNMIQIVK